MAFAEHHCVTVVCDGCGDGWEEEPWHFDSRQEAIDYLRGADWLVTEGRVLCRSCAEKADCQATGHQLGDWEDRQMEGVDFRRRHCSHCPEVQFDPPFLQLSDLLHAARTVNGLTGDSQ